MCGIAGLISRRDLDQVPLLERAHRVQAHRGPDATGTLVRVVGHSKVGFAHQRLSIIDLSSDANQPMASRDGTAWIIYNGEIYNYVEIRQELIGLGWSFSTTSDTEVLLAALDQWGPREALQKCNGMWAFAWLDEKNQRLVLARDRAGKKPLHYFFGDQGLLFASEIKTILEMSGRKFSLNHEAVANFLNQSVLDATSETFFRDIHRLPAAHYAVVDLRAANPQVELHRYWEPSVQCEVRSVEETIEQVREVFLDAVRLRLRSDVPVGVLLSGGIDSSAIAAAMNAHLGSSTELNLLSAVSPDQPEFDESEFIDLVAQHLRRPVHKVTLHFPSTEAIARLSEATWFHDEPVGSFSTVAHYLLMKKARELGITVVLSGQGADELLCGYRKYLGFYLHQLMKEGRFLKALSVLRSFQKQKTVLGQFTLQEAKRYLPVLRFPLIDIRGQAIESVPAIQLGLDGLNLQQRQKADLECFSVPILTHYEDRMSMAWSREVRLPFLDYRLMDSLLPLPPEFKLRDGWTKYVFRRAVEPLLPPGITWRKDKQPFINPQGEWLKEELREEVEDHFSTDSFIVTKGLVKRPKLQQLYSVYRRQKPGTGLYSFKDVFNPLSLEVFLRRFASHIQ